MGCGTGGHKGSRVALTTNNTTNCISSLYCTYYSVPPSLVYLSCPSPFGRDRFSNISLYIRRCAHPSVLTVCALCPFSFPPPLCIPLLCIPSLSILPSLRPDFSPRSSSSGWSALRPHERRPLSFTWPSNHSHLAIFSLAYFPH